MLIDHHRYFLVLIIALVVYWRLGIHPRRRLAFVIASGILAMAFLLSRAMSAALAGGLLLALMFSATATFGITRLMARTSSANWLRVGLVVPFSTLVVTYLEAKLAVAESLPWMLPISISFFIYGLLPFCKQIVLLTNPVRLLPYIRLLSGI